jgi:excinuclease UvrABC helicase subunit UvrB
MIREYVSPFKHNVHGFAIRIMRILVGSGFKFNSRLDNQPLWRNEYLQRCGVIGLERH